MKTTKDNITDTKLSPVLSILEIEKQKRLK